MELYYLDVVLLFKTMNLLLRIRIYKWLLKLVRNESMSLILMLYLILGYLQSTSIHLIRLGPINVWLSIHLL